MIELSCQCLLASSMQYYYMKKGLNSEKYKQIKPKKKVANRPEEIFQLLLSNLQQLPPNLLLEAWLHPSVKKMSN